MTKTLLHTTINRRSSVGSPIAHAFVSTYAVSVRHKLRLIQSFASCTTHTVEHFNIVNGQFLPPFVTIHYGWLFGNNFNSIINHVKINHSDVFVKYAFLVKKCSEAPGFDED